MTYSNSLQKDLSHLETFNILEDEMSKYKTLNHEKIDWNIVYEYSLDILKHASIEAKICNYFIISCIYINKEECFDELLCLLTFLKDFLQKNPLSLKEGTLNTQKKKIKESIIFFVTEANRLELSIGVSIASEINSILLELEKDMEFKFTPIKIIQTNSSLNPKNKTSNNTPQSNSSLKLANFDTLNDREHRELYLNLSLDLLNQDLNNLNAYAFFFEAMWGRIKKLPPHQENITQIRQPNSTLINLLQNLEKNSNDLEQIQNFIKNLILNPFWFDGLQLFYKILIKQQRENIHKMFKIFVGNFLNKFQEITKLKFENGELLCNISTYNYFTKSDNLNSQQNSQDTQAHSISKNFEEAFLKINQDNSKGSLFSNIQSLIEMAQVFEEKGMKQNANILYLLLKEKLENTFLKDYLEEYYLFIQGKINNF